MRDGEPEYGTKSCSENQEPQQRPDEGGKKPPTLLQEPQHFAVGNARQRETSHLLRLAFDSSKIVNLSRYGDAGPGPKSQVMVMSFELAGQSFMALNDGPVFKFTEAISLVVNCETQHEVDHFWNKLLVVGSPQQCGWLKDKFGLSWQIVPTILGKLMSDKDATRSGRVMQAMMQMVKPDIAKLRAAYDGKKILISPM